MPAIKRFFRPPLKITRPPISSFGAVILIISFFLPWVTVSCGNPQVTVTGLQAASGSGFDLSEFNFYGDARLFAVPIAALVVLGLTLTGWRLRALATGGAAASRFQHAVDWATLLAGASLFGFVLAKTYPYWFGSVVTFEYGLAVAALGAFAIADGAAMRLLSRVEFEQQVPDLLRWMSPRPWDAP